MIRAAILLGCVLALGYIQSGECTTDSECLAQCERELQRPCTDADIFPCEDADECAARPIMQPTMIGVRG